MDKPSKPDWTYWLNLPDVELSAAVELSVDVAPGWFSRIESERYHPMHHEGLRRKIATRMQIARAHARSGTLETEQRSDSTNVFPFTGDPYEVVNPAKFRAWGESLASPLTFPAEFPEAARSADSTLPRVESGEPLDPRERTTMLRIIRALCVMAALPDRGATSSIQLQLEKLGFTSTPKDAAIRKVLAAAGALAPDSKPQ